MTRGRRGGDARKSPRAARTATPESKRTAPGATTPASAPPATTGASQSTGMPTRRAFNANMVTASESSAGTSAIGSTIKQSPNGALRRGNSSARRRIDIGIGVLPDWIIVGGESGTAPRMMDAAWARDVRDQCRKLGIPFFMKQMTGSAPIPADLMIREFPR